MSKKLLMAAADAAAANEKHVQIPLSKWIEGDAAENNLSLAASKDLRQKESIIRKVTVAYGLVELLIRCPANNVLLDDDAKIGIDNFAVCVVDRSSSQRQLQQPSSSSWDDIRGVRMLSSGLSLSIEEPSYLSCLFEEGGERNIYQMGRYLEVELDAANALVGITKKDHQDSNEGKEISNLRCHYLLAQILQQLFTNDEGKVLSDDSCEPAQKKAKKVKMEVPTSICRVVQNLFESASESGGDAYKTLEEVGKDLHLLLFDPDRFLFDREAQITDKMQLRFKKGKLYGRDEEETLITDTFCRVTRGKSEAFFIGGFSGSGKSMLVDTLRVNVKNVGGYVIKHKFDAMSQDRPLSGIISALNQLCLMIKKRLSPRRLTALSEKLKDDFGDDIDLLARMLPNICLLSPDCSTLSASAGVEEENASDKMNPRSVSFTLLRFVRLVSSPRNPIMLFLDDLQWADDTAFDTIHTFLSDTMGSCMLFVGTYRDNEVEAGHAIFDLMDNLEASNVPTNKVTLTGLDEENVNEMISDALCLYPRICKSLSNIVFQKTKGNPYFVLEFMQSLQSRGLIQYDSSQKRWVWNEVTIRSEEITDNVLHLLSSKMNQLPNDMQLLLKVMSCFGTSTKEAVIGYLAESPEYSELRSGLEGAISDGFVEVYARGYIKFVHDKVREAAYNLIPDKDKKQLHYNLGKTLYSICKGKDVGDTIFLIASQINHGKEFIEKDDALRIPVAKLNMKAGKMALDGCDHSMAYHYFAAALSLLPDDSWESNYNLTLRLNFLMARAANSSCRYDEAEVTLQTICKRALCLQDKLPSYYLLVMILVAQGHANEAYTKCSSILVQLGEAAPDAVTVEVVRGMIPETLSMYSNVYGDHWLGRKMEDTNLCSITKFYSVIATAAYFCQPTHMVAYFACKVVQISLQNGVCEHTPLALMQLSSIAFNRTMDVRFTNAAFIHGIAKSALVLSEKFGSSDERTQLCVNYSMGAGHLEPYHLNASQLRKGFSAGLSSGGANTAFFCATHGIRFSIFSAEKDLTSLLKEIDYYLLLLETYKNELAKKITLCYRETVATLIDKGETTGIEAKLSLRDVEACDIGQGNKLQEVLYSHQMFRNYWLGYTARCHYYGQKCATIFKEIRAFAFHFYYGLNLLDAIKKKKNYSKSVEVDEIIASMKIAASHAETNFRNKLELLEAEKYGISGHHESDVALHAYNKSILSAQKAGFLHEQGLACEKAGLYCKRMKDNENALAYFNQALVCYEKWGSSVKVEFIRKELGQILHRAN